MYTPLNGYYLPVSPFRTDTKGFENGKGTVEIVVPKLEPSELSDIIRDLRQGQLELDAIPREEMMDAFARTLEAWQDPEYKWRVQAEDILPATLGYSPEMIKIMLDSTFKRLAADLADIEQAEYSPELVVTVYPDIPGPQVLATLQGLYNGAAVFCKPPDTEPIFTALFLASLAEQEPRFAGSVAAVPWKGGAEKPLEEILYGSLGKDDRIVLFGSDKMMSEIKTIKGKDVPVSAYSRGLGIIVLGKEYISEDKINSTVAVCATSASMYNRNACVSPQTIIVEEGGEVSPSEFAKRLGNAMTELTETLPVGMFRDDNYARFAQAHRSYLLQSIFGTLDYFPVTQGGKPVGGVAYLKDGKFSLPGAGGRLVTVYPVNDISETGSVLKDFSDKLHTIGLAAEEERYEGICDALLYTGARISPVEEMLQLSFDDYRIFE